MQTTTIQYWPSGDSVTYAGDPFGADVWTYPREWAGTTTPGRPMSEEERRELRVQVRAERLLDTDVLCCDSTLVGALMELHGHGDLGAAFAWDEVENLYPDPDTMTPEEMRTYVEERGGDVPEVPADDDDYGDYVRALEDAVRDCAEPAEVYEWWRVSSWLCRTLREAGEVVLDNDYGCWWGRQCTGQAVLMDGTLQRVARMMGA